MRLSLLLLACFLAVPQLHSSQQLLTKCDVIDSGREGPAVILSGSLLAHGTAGAYAAEEIRHWRLARGKLLLVRSETDGLAEEIAKRAAEDLTPSASLPPAAGIDLES